MIVGQWGIHAKVARLLWSEDELIPIEEAGGDEIVQLSVDPFLISVFAFDDLGVVTAVNNKLKCLSCKSSVTSCSHVRLYSNWAAENDQHLPLAEEKVTDKFVTKSQIKIPYPFTDEMVRRYDELEQGSKLPAHLIPTFDPTEKCEHGNHFQDISTEH